ncbi:MAG: hypothetical protein ACOZCO_07205 [Bacteroidota bacterium]
MLFFFGCHKEKAEEIRPAPCEYDVSFNSEIKPLIISRCANNSCHAFLMNGIDLIFSDYSDIYEASLMESFLATIKHQPGFPMMPQDTTQLLPEEIQIIECWIEQGRKNN